MADSRAKIEFQTKKAIFDEIASEVICMSCKVVPRNTPIYQTDTGFVLCAECKPKSDLAGIHQSPVLEKLLMTLPVSCKYQKNDCPMVQDRKNIWYHEEDCDFRDIECPRPSCTDTIAFCHLEKHFEDVENHKIIKETCEDITFKGDGIYEYFTHCQEKYLDGQEWKLSLFIQPDKSSQKFFIQDQFHGKYFSICVQLFASIFEAQNFQCSLKIVDESNNEYCFHGNVKSIDDGKCHGSGLIVPISVLKDVNKQKIEIEIKCLKSDNTEDAESNVSESDNDS